ncbi:MAG: GntR family transcriptional regulator [Alphaproteobacteria bacterium]|nr:GntR family transcriptional regulator [Alphaproteobacteria bacterium]
MASSRNKRTGGGTEKSGGARVLQTLRERITRHDLPPGSKLLEKELSAEFGVSRARIREVMGVLEQRGLIRRIPNRGAVVERLDPSQVFHIYHVREALEGVCARLATENMPPESWQDLVELFGDPIDRDVAAGDLEAYIVKLETLRRRTIEGARNPVLADMLDNIQDRTRMIIRRIIILPGRAQVGAQQHRAVLEAMRRGDAAAAETAKRANMRSAIDYLHRYQSFVL